MRVNIPQIGRYIVTCYHIVDNSGTSVAAIERKIQCWNASKRRYTYSGNVVRNFQAQAVEQGLEDIKGAYLPPSIPYRRSSASRAIRPE